jgi:hypothetical protein
MKKTQLLFVLFISFSFSFAQSPITLGTANMPGSGDTLRYTNVQIASIGNYTQTGINFNWNFGSVISTSSDVRSFRNAFQTPYAIFFLSLNEYGEKIADTLGAGPLVFTRYYNYYRKQTSPNAFIADGSAVTASSIPLPSYYSDKDELYNFPMTYPKYDSTSFRFSTLATTLIPVRYSKTGFRATRVDGWGTVATPYGTEACLRLITTQYSQDSIKLSFGPVSLPLGFPNVVRSYQWMTLTSKIPFFEVTGNVIAGTFSVTQARYRGFKVSGQNNVGLTELNENNSVQLFPNPVNDKLVLKLIDGKDTKIIIYDCKGNPIGGDHPNNTTGEFLIDVSAFESGLYFVEVINGDKRSFYKFLKQ